MSKLTRASGLSIKFILNGTVGAIALLLVTISGWSLFEGWRSYQTAEHIEAVTTVDKLVFQAMQAMRNDRSSLNRALIDAEPDNKEARDDVDSMKAIAVPALAAALEAISHGDVPDHDRWLTKLQQGAQQYDNLRRQAEAALQLPVAQRDDTIRKTFYAYAATYVDGMGDASAAFAGSIRLVDPVVDQLLAARDLSWTVRDSDSRYRRQIEDALIAGNISAASRQKATDAHAELDTAWDALQSALNADQTAQELTTAVAGIKKGYFADFAPQRDTVFEALSSGQKTEMTAKQWRSLSKPPSELLKSFVNLVVDVIQKHAASRVTQLRLGLLLDIAFLAAAVALCLFGFTIVSRRVVRPMSSLTRAMAVLAEGDLSVAIPGTDRRDEIGSMAAAVGVFKENAVQRQRLEAEQQAEVAAKQLRAEAVEQLISGFDAKIKGVLDTVSAAVVELNGTAQQMTGSAADSAEKATAVAAASEEASANVKTVAAATDDLAKSTQEIGQQASMSQNIARQAVSEAEHTNGTVAGLVETAANVGKVIELINSIASQTNLLALNATIEAARAGDAGKGFAVVASEVKNLANQTAKATDQISEQILAMQSVSSAAANAIKGIGGTINRIDEIAAAIAAAVEQQNTATAEISGNIQQAARGTEEVSGNIVQVNEVASRTGASARQVLVASQDLTREAEAMRSMVLDFLAAMRAA
ncbi:MAG TPA: HAMP domain-containing methyl-accepting chemotaxis protein [Dongiaceae bacterium]|nr:HAMP domain-containing methyl-accepting chemotaxis protein [Dongiaceae bacterium]